MNRQIGLTARSATVWLLATALGGGMVRLLVTDLLHAAATRADSPDSAVTAVTTVCETALIGCVTWAWLATTAVVVEALLGLRPNPSTQAAGLPGVPRAWRRCVLMACGVAVTVGVALPATATPGSVHLDPGGHDGRGGAVAVLDGLPLPQRATDRVTSPRRATAPTPTPLPTRAPTPTPTPTPEPVSAPGNGPHVVVQPGDSLWSIAAADRGGLAELSPAGVAARWREIYRLNLAVVGDDPDLIVPGQRLALPPS